MIEVTQADRKLYIALYGGRTFAKAHYEQTILDGKWDDTEQMQTIARHRIASQAAVIRAAIEAAAKACGGYMEDCLEDNDVRKNWPNIQLRNQTYAAAIRALSVEQIMKGMGE